MNIEPAVRTSAKRQVTIHRLTGAVWIFLGVLFGAAIFVPGKEGEDVARILSAIFGIFSVILGAVYIKFMSARTALLVELLLYRRHELRQPVLIVRKVNGRIVGYGVSLRDTANRKYKMQVLAEQDARAMLADIPQT